MKLLNLSLFLLLSLMLLCQSSARIRNLADESMVDESDEGSPDEEDKVAAVTERECELKTKGDDKVEFECKAKSEDDESEIKDEIEFKVSYDDEKGLKVKVKYEQEIETAVQETETETSYEVHFDRVIEYAKPDGSSPPTTAAEMAYDWANDVVVSELPLTNWTGFSDILSSGDTNATTYQFTLSTADGIATFGFTIRQGLGDQDLTAANKMKIDFDIMDYPWERDDTYIALISAIESEQEIEVEYEDVDGGDGQTVQEPQEVSISFDEAVAGTGVQAFGEFTWATDAEVMTTTNTSVAVSRNQEGIVIEVVATSPADDPESVAFSFVDSAAQGASHIYWDPEAGVGYRAAAADGAPSSAASHGRMGCFTFGLVAILGAVFAL